MVLSRLPHPGVVKVRTGITSPTLYNKTRSSLISFTKYHRTLHYAHPLALLQLLDSIYKAYLSTIAVYLVDYNCHIIVSIHLATKYHWYSLMISPACGDVKSRLLANAVYFWVKRMIIFWYLLTSWVYIQKSILSTVIVYLK